MIYDKNTQNNSLSKGQKGSFDKAENQEQTKEDNDLQVAINRHSFGLKTFYQQITANAFRKIK